MKKFIRIAFVAAFAAIAGYGIYEGQKTDVMSDLMLANTEALADVEIIVGEPCLCVKNSWCMYFYPWEQWEEEGAFYN